MAACGNDVGSMVLPVDIGNAAQDEDIEQVKAWLQSGGSMDESRTTRTARGTHYYIVARVEVNGARSIVHL